MTFDYKLFHEDGTNSIEKFNLNPDTCPHCGKGIDVRYCFGIKYQNEAQVIFQCPLNDCKNLFIAYYYEQRNGIFSFQCVEPSYTEERKFNEHISQVSLSFTQIYNQSLKAEMFGLNQIAGCGYRKALEFLIKDYAMKTTDEKDHETIKKSFLGHVIDNYINNENIKTTAKCATWLGNDETHYIRKWEQMDLTNLKELIELSLRWIEMEEITKEYQERMKLNE